MATLTHRGLRTLIDQWGGCDYFFSEMVDCKSYVGNRKFESYYTDPAPHPDKLILQFVSADHEEFVKALTKAQDLPVAGFDINMGCSAHQICDHGAGIAWMSGPEEAWRLLESLRPLVRSGKTLSVKLRLGEKEDPAYLSRFCRGLEAVGVDFITLHPRTKKDKMGRPSRWTHLTELKADLKIPLWGNGDIRDVKSSNRGWETGADGLMIGREAVRSPWIFHFLKEKEKNQNFTLQVDLQEQAHQFHRLLEAHQPQEFWPTRAQRFWDYYFDHFPFGHKVKENIKRMRVYEDIRQACFAYLDTHPQEMIKVLV